jgi:hypothetical protein
MKSFVIKTYRLLASYGFAVILMLFLMVLTFLGTMGQVDRGLYAIQKEYFESAFLVHWFFGVIPVPLPGVFLLMVLFTINLVFGGIIRARKGWREWGMLVTHLGAIMLLVGCFVAYKYSTHGSMLLHEGEIAAHFESNTVWDLHATKLGADSKAESTFAVHSEEFGELKHRRWLVFPPLARINYETDNLPFSFSLFGYHENCAISDDGATLTAKPAGASAEENVPGVTVELKDKAGQTSRGVLWGMAETPFRAKLADGEWVFELKRRSYPLPFEIRLDKFIHEQHPGTSIAKAFISDVTRTEAGASQTARISMNAPMRHKGYAFYQSSWGGGDNQAKYSVLSVVKNPADKFPQYACTVVAAGLFIHFCLRLIAYLRKQNRERVS